MLSLYLSKQSTFSCTRHEHEQENEVNQGGNILFHDCMILTMTVGTVGVFVSGLFMCISSRPGSQMTLEMYFRHPLTRNPLIPSHNKNMYISSRWLLYIPQVVHFVRICFSRGHSIVSSSDFKDPCWTPDKQTEGQNWIFTKQQII